MDICAVNVLTYEEFLEIFGNVVEKCPLIPAAIWTHRPFSSLAEIEAHISDFIDSLSQSGKEGILRCHPDLAGRDHLSGTLTRDSQEEQREAGMTTLEHAELSRLTRLNSAYKERFGFPFVICARMNSKAAIMRQLVERLENSRPTETKRAIEEVKKICHLRIRYIVLSDVPNKL
ncbi:2-oxo-4-hydroxy-4-carboxy-5-ureidoimidazoline decarboxylase [Electrophorus electricus]|uniref:2-oxo-4-hydroxy-4-carboxy-5-ureidoimidazoline decarboxylase n=1 Tax=Electrophorus electricus TaxID=8005 RepID=A0A4W4HES4_ELEEL|nr:2-oxo-4-hydroxy-4-carboxy-5-ureidoimidazoline decarboxylase [Electrophorus electricus]